MLWLNVWLHLGRTRKPTLIFQVYSSRVARAQGFLTAGFQDNVPSPKNTNS